MSSVFLRQEPQPMEEEEPLPKSSCSIDEPPQALSQKNVYSHSELPLSSKGDKSMKYISDRFFPLRKMPCSAKDLFNDHCEWMSDGENEDSKAPRGMTVRDVYKAEVLG